MTAAAAGLFGFGHGGCMAACVFALCWCRACAVLVHVPSFACAARACACAGVPLVCRHWPKRRSHLKPLLWLKRPLSRPLTAEFLTGIGGLPAAGQRGKGG